VCEREREVRTSVCGARGERVVREREREGRGCVCEGDTGESVSVCEGV